MILVLGRRLRFDLGVFFSVLRSTRELPHGRPAGLTPSGRAGPGRPPPAGAAHELFSRWLFALYW